MSVVPRPHYATAMCESDNVNIEVHCYRPQRSWAKVMFLQASVILFTGGRMSASVHAGIPPPREQNPRADHHPPWEQTPPPEADTPRADTPQSRPPREAHASIRSMSGRFASYWNAFLFVMEVIMRLHSQWHIVDLLIDFSIHQASHSKDGLQP